jgi:hypothetical protein
MMFIKCLIDTSFRVDRMIIQKAIKGSQVVCTISKRVFSKSSLVNKPAAKYTTSLNIFDRETKRSQKNLTSLDANYKDYEYVKSEVGYRVADRVFDIKRSFDTILDLGCQRGYVSKHLTKVRF